MVRHQMLQQVDKKEPQRFETSLSPIFSDVENESISSTMLFYMHLQIAEFVLLVALCSQSDFLQILLFYINLSE